jgi:hypothetical protein
MATNRMKAAHALAEALHAVTSDGDEVSSRSGVIRHIAEALEELGFEVEADTNRRSGSLRLLAVE